MLPNIDVRQSMLMTELSSPYLLCMDALFMIHFSSSCRARRRFDIYIVSREREMRSVQETSDYNRNNKYSRRIDRLYLIHL